ncbi:MAG: hypothetical protein ABEJ76_07770 [Halanaeroarchaeum sp.]
MVSSLRVHVNREDVRSVSPEADRIEVDGPFDLVLENHGQSTHVHGNVDDALAAVADLPENNWYVESGETRTIPVDVESLEEVRGHLLLATGYGAEETAVEVTVEAGSGGVEVDEDLASITVDRDAEVEESASYLLPGVFVALGVLVSAAVLVLVDDVVAVTMGLAAVVVAVGAALYLLLVD